MSHPDFYRIEPLVKHIVQTFEDAVAELAKLSDLLAVLSQPEVACTEELHEKPHIVPREKEHEREGNEIPESPPEAKVYPQKDDRHKKADRNRDEGAYRYSERADEHLVLYKLLEEDLRNDEQKSRRDYRHDEQRQEKKQSESSQQDGLKSRIMAEEPVSDVEFLYARHERGNIIIDAFHLFRMLLRSFLQGIYKFLVRKQA